MKLKNKIYKFLPIILVGLQFNFIFTQSLEDELQKEISEFEKQSKQVFNKKIESDRCRKVSKSNNTFTIVYRDRSGCEKYKDREFYKGSLTSEGDFFNTGVLHKMSREDGGKIKEIYVGGIYLGYTYSKDDVNCLYLFAKNSGNDRHEFAYSEKNCGLEREGKFLRLYSREIENLQIKTNWYLDTISSNIRGTEKRTSYFSNQDDFEKQKEIVLDFIYSSEIARKIPKNILIDAEIFSESTYQTFRANLRNFIEQNELQPKNLDYYSNTQNWSPETEVSQEISSPSDSSEGISGWAVFGISAVVLVMLITFQSIRTTRKEEAEAREKARLEAERKKAKEEERRLFKEEAERKAKEKAKKVAEELELKKKKEREDLSKRLKEFINKDVPNLQKKLSEELEKNLKNFEELVEVISDEEENLRKLKENHPDIAKVVKTRNIGDSSTGIIKKIKNLIKDF